MRCAIASSCVRALLDSLKPMLLVGAVCGLLLLEPDFGAAVVMLSITLSVLFVGGARLRDFFVFTTAVLACAHVTGWSLHRIAWRALWRSGILGRIRTTAGSN